MDQTLADLYPRYVRAVQFFNAHLERRHVPENIRSALRLKTVSEEDFPDWWERVSVDTEARHRWIERLNDPAASLESECRRITEELHKLPIRRAAA